MGPTASSTSRRPEGRGRTLKQAVKPGPPPRLCCCRPSRCYPGFFSFLRCRIGGRGSAGVGIFGVHAVVRSGGEPVLQLLELGEPTCDGHRDFAGRFTRARFPQSAPDQLRKLLVSLDLHLSISLENVVRLSTRQFSESSAQPSFNFDRRGTATTCPMTAYDFRRWLAGMSSVQRTPSRSNRRFAFPCRARAVSCSVTT